MERPRALLGPGGDGGRRLGLDRPDAVDRGAHAHGRVLAERLDPLRPGLGAAIGEAPLHLVELGADSPAQVAGVDQRDPDPCLARGLDQGAPHRVRVRVRRSARAVVEIVELADRGDSGQRHLPERRPGQGPV